MVSESVAKSSSLLNLALCDQYGDIFKIERPHNLVLISRQLDQLQESSKEHRSAHLAYMIVKLKPFAKQNLRTACLAAQQYIGKPIRLYVFANLLKDGADVKSLEGVITKA